MDGLGYCNALFLLCPAVAVGCGAALYSTVRIPYGTELSVGVLNGYCCNSRFGAWRPPAIIRITSVNIPVYIDEHVQVIISDTLWLFHGHLFSLAPRYVLQLRLFRRIKYSHVQPKREKVRFNRVQYSVFGIEHAQKLRRDCDGTVTSL